MPVFLKQYGEKRTGTNYLRALLRANSPGTVPLMHVLGDKHSPPVALDEYWQLARTQADPAFEFVKAATFAAPAESTHPEDPTQLEHLRALAEPLAESVANGQLGFVISVKHPYAWAASFAKYSGWMIRTDRGLRMELRFAPALASACGDFNLRHESWLKHNAKFPSRSAIVRYEDLLKNPMAVLSSLVKKFGLEPAAEVLTAISGYADATDWDNCELLISGQPFSPRTYHDKTFVMQLSRNLWDIVGSTINWKLAQDFGYNRLTLD